MVVLVGALGVYKALCGKGRFSVFLCIWMYLHAFGWRSEGEPYVLLRGGSWHGIVKGAA